MMAILSMPQFLPLLPYFAPAPLNQPVVRPAMAFSPVCRVERMCSSMLRDRSKIFSMGGLMWV